MSSVQSPVTGCLPSPLGRAHWGSIRLMLLLRYCYGYMNRMLSLRVRRANIELLIFFDEIFLFLYFSFRNSPVYPPFKSSYAQRPTSFPQFKKVFNAFAGNIHTVCAERIGRKYFAGIRKLQNAVSLPSVGISRHKRRPASA